MEFLDDLRKERDSEPEPQEKKPKKKTPQAPPPPSEEAWGDLLAGVQFDEPDEVSPAEAQPRKARRFLGLSRGQQIVLGVLVVAVLAIWGGVLLGMLGAFPGSRTPWASDAMPTNVALVDSTPVPAEGEAAMPAEAAATEALSTPTATATLIPTGPVATSLDERLRKDPNNIDLYLQRGYEYLSLGALDAAAGDFEEAITLDAERAEAYEGLGWARYDQFRWQEAEKAFTTAVSFSEDLPTAHFGLGLIAYYRGDYKAAASEFDWAAEVDRAQAKYESWLAIASAQLGDAQEAQGAVSRAISLTDQANIVYVARAEARLIEDPPDIDGAQGDLLYAQGLEPNDFLTLNTIARFYVRYRPERLSEAEQLATYARNWADNDVEMAVALQTLGEIYLAQGRMGDAQQVLTQAAALASQDGEIALAGLAEDLAQAGE